MVDRRTVVKGLAGAAVLTGVAAVGDKQGKIAKKNGEIKAPKKK